MGLMENLLTLLFGNGRNVVRETAEVFRENAESEASRSSDMHREALAQMASEFNHAHRGRFDQFMDGLNRVPRPALALGTLGLFIAAMVDPVWFGARMEGLTLVPEALWWLLGAIVSFYFGARHQAKGQEFHRRIAETMTRTSRQSETVNTPPQGQDRPVQRNGGEVRERPNRSNTRDN